MRRNLKCPQGIKGCFHTFGTGVPLSETPATPRTADYPMPIVPSANAHPTASLPIKIGISLAPTDARPPWTPAPSTPLAATAVIATRTTCLGTAGREADNTDSQYDGRKNFYELDHRCLSVAAITVKSPITQCMLN